MLPWRRFYATPPSRRAAAAPHRTALPPVVLILSLHNPVVQRE